MQGFAYLPMTPARIGGALTLLAFFLTVGRVEPVAAQIQRAIPATATLPENNEAAILSSGVREAIQAGDVRLAIRRIEQVMQLSGELVAGADGRTYQPVWRHARRLFAMLPPAGVDMYRTMYDAEVSARFQEARGQVDLAGLRDLFEHYPLASAVPDIGRELAALLVDQGAYGEALEIMREMEQSGHALTSADRALRIVALAGIGAWPSVQREIDLTHTADAPQRAGNRLNEIIEWVGRKREFSGHATEHQMLAPMLRALRRWEEPLPSPVAAGIDDDDALASAAAQKGRWPLIQPLISGDLLLVRCRGAIWALDEMTLAVRWKAVEAKSPPVAQEYHKGGNMRLRVLGAAGGIQIIDGDSQPEVDISSDAQSLLFSHVGNSLSADSQRVYSIEAVATSASDTGIVAGRNELVARDRQTGGIVWRVGSDPTGELGGAVFQDVPIAVGDSLAVAMLYQNELRVALLDPRDGRLLRVATVVGRPLYLPPEGGACRLTSDETTLYVSTGNGVIAAFSAETLHWKWASLYPSTVGARFGDMWRGAPDVDDQNSEPPVLIGDLLILAPPDSSDRLALDRFTGQERWRVPRRGEPFVIGANEWGVVVAGNHVVCVDESDGKSVRWRSVALEISGRPALRDERLFVPTRAGVIVLDSKTGRIVADQWSPDEAIRAARAPSAANVVVSESGVFCVSPNFAVRLADPVATRRAADEMIARGAAPGRAHLARAWLSVLEGQYPEALASMQEIAPDDVLAAARDRLLGSVFVALSRESTDVTERLKWLEQARSLARSPEAAARLALLVGGVLEETQNWREAFDLYRDVLLRDTVLCAADGNDSGWLVSSDALATESMTGLFSRAPAPQREEMIDSLIASAAKLDVPGLRKVIAVAPAGSSRAALERALLQRRPPPELSIAYLGAVNDPALDDAARRAALIDQWELHTALGMIDAARNDADSVRALPFEATSGAATQPADLSVETAEDQARRVERIERSMRKLAGVREEPFRTELRFRWKIDGGRLLQDAAAPLAFSKPWMLIHDETKSQIVLCAVRGGERLRETHATPSAAPMPEVNGQKQDARPFWQPLDHDDFSTTPTATVVRDHLAAVIVPGGVVCVGLGPERRGGQRLWDRLVSEWTTLPDNVEERVRGCAAGILLMPRPGRLLLLRWNDGRIAWQRDLPGMTIRGWQTVADRVLILGDDGRLMSMRCDNGGDLRHSSTEFGTIIDLAAVSDLPVIWTESAMLGLNADSLTIRWRREIEGIAEHSIVHGTSWMAMQPAPQQPWLIVDAANGKDVTSEGLTISGVSSAWAADANFVYVACDHESEQESARGRRSQSVSAFSIATGATEWSHRFDGVSTINASQILGHPSLIPVLVDPSTTPGNQRGWAGLELQLISKSNGATSPPESIGKDFDLRVQQMRGNVDMLVTPSRIVVQCKGVLAAYGSSATETSP